VPAHSKAQLGRATQVPSCSQSTRATGPGLMLGEQIYARANFKSLWSFAGTGL